MLTIDTPASQPETTTMCHREFPMLALLKDVVVGHVLVYARYSSTSASFFGSQASSGKGTEDIQSFYTRQLVARAAGRACRQVAADCDYLQFVRNRAELSQQLESSMRETLAAEGVDLESAGFAMISHEPCGTGDTLSLPAEVSYTDGKTALRNIGQGRCCLSLEPQAVCSRDGFDVRAGKVHIFFRLNKSYDQFCRDGGIGEISSCLQGALVDQAAETTALECETGFQDWPLQTRLRSLVAGAVTIDEVFVEDVTVPTLDELLLRRNQAWMHDLRLAAITNAGR